MSTRVALAHLPTPVEAMPRLGARLGLSRLFVKRDDLTGLALGGNKARKLERLCADALAQHCDTLVTGGGHQSNHARMTAAAANHLGLECHLALGGTRPRLLTGNLLVDDVLGATMHFSGARDYYGIEQAIVDLAGRLEADGRRPYVIPIGGASVAGATAYVDAATELAGQLEDEGGGGTPEWVFVADGSGGTHAGLLVGLDARTRVVGVDVGTRPDLDTEVGRLACEVASARSLPAPAGEVTVDHEHFGAGYAIPTGDGVAAMRAVARDEGLILDPVYTGKAMAALFDWARDGRIAPQDRVVFWHTGGAVALFAGEYAELFGGEVPEA